MDTIAAAQAEGLAAELAARKALLSRTISCARAEAVALRVILDKTPVESGNKILQAQLSGRLEDAQNYYDIELEKVKEVGLAGTQSIAREVLAWRQSNYDITALQVDNFLLWEKNQPLFQVAQDRITQMRNIVMLLEQAGQHNDLESAFSSAETWVQAAMDQNSAAKAVLVRLLSPNESLAAIKQSLQSLSEAYKQFFNVSNIVQDLLATKKK